MLFAKYAKYCASFVHHIVVHFVNIRCDAYDVKLYVCTISKNFCKNVFHHMNVVDLGFLCLYDG